MELFDNLQQVIVQPIFDLFGDVIRNYSIVGGVSIIKLPFNNVSSY
jgi:hypothetical protein